MLYDLDGFTRLAGRTYALSDLTMIVGVRAHDHNPWALERVELLGGYYAPGCATIVVDFGSALAYAEQLEAACARGGLSYLRVEDEGLFSASKARNAGAMAARTELLFFSDVDCFGPRDLVQRLLEHANRIELGACFDQLVNMPVYHVAQAASAPFFGARDHDARSAYLDRLMAHATYSMRDVEYVDPHSNFFACRRDFFDLIGGYNEAFRGHGSEDFEFFLRALLHSRQLPLPERPDEDHYSPMRETFFWPKRYRGFRRLFTAMAMQAEVHGLRIAHLHHPRSGRAGPDHWYRSNDWRREKFRKQVLPVLADRTRLVERDFLPRSKRLLVLLKHREQVDFFLPLRLRGYRLELVRADDRESLASAERAIRARSVDGVAVFNPYMSSHRLLHPLFELARAEGLGTIVVERGVLPESWYYASDVAYADRDFAELDLSKHVFSDEQLRLAEAYLARLRRGRHTLERNGDFEATLARRGSLKSPGRTLCLVPLQLDDDVAVTQHTSGFASYRDFKRDVLERARRFPDVLFLVKPHPLSKAALECDAPNVLILNEGDNIHALLELCDGVVCYNSGVGFLALCHEKPLVTIGNAFYNLAGFGERAATLAEAIERVTAQEPSARPSIVRYVAWLLHEKYAFFRAESQIRVAKQRRVHGYTDLTWYSIPGIARPTLRASLSRRLEPRSYLAGRLAIEAPPVLPAIPRSRKQWKREARAAVRRVRRLLLSRG